MSDFAFGVLAEYWQVIVAYILGIVSLVEAELFVDWYRKRRDGPKVWAKPELDPHAKGDSRI